MLYSVKHLSSFYFRSIRTHRLLGNFEQRCFWVETQAFWPNVRRGEQTHKRQFLVSCCPRPITHKIFSSGTLTPNNLTKRQTDVVLLSWKGLIKSLRKLCRDCLYNVRFPCMQHAEIVHTTCDTHACNQPKRLF